MNFFLILAFAFFVLILVIILLALQKVAKPASPSPVPSPPDSRDIRTLVAPFMRPSILINKVDADDEATHASSSTATSHFGGTPPQYPGFTWPQRDGHPLGFLACIDLAALPNVFDWLPRTGHLLFFYDMDENPWGDADQHGGWTVLHTQHPINTTTPKATPPAHLNPASTVQHKGMSFGLASLPPHYDEEAIAHLQLNYAESDALMDLRQDLIDSPHQIGGYPDPIQNHDMPVECEAAMILIENPDAAQLAKPNPDQVKRWQLLFQMASDDDLGFMWGDVGTLYFFVREDDARRGDFSKVWLIAQCC